MSKDKNGRFSMRAIWIALLIGLLTAPAFAQITPGFRLNETKEISEDEKARMKANEDAAKAARAKIPDAKPGDPWAGARAADPSPAPKAKPKKTN